MVGGPVVARCPKCAEIYYPEYQGSKCPFCKQESEESFEKELPEKLGILEELSQRGKKVMASINEFYARLPTLKDTSSIISEFKAHVRELVSYTDDFDRIIESLVRDWVVAKRKLLKAQKEVS